MVSIIFFVLRETACLYDTYLTNLSGALPASDHAPTAARVPAGAHAAESLLLRDETVPGMCADTERPQTVRRLQRGAQTMQVLQR